jgi:SAM-dependent methyltransferase
MTLATKLSSTDSPVAKIAADMGLVGPFPQLQYVRYMERVFGRDGGRFLDAVDNWGARGCPSESAQRLYLMLAKKPAMAAYVSRHQYSRIYLKAAEILFDSGLLRNQLVIDFGCGFGHLTQLLARLHPESQVVGIDLEPIVAAARTVAGRAAPENLRFESQISASADRASPHVMLMTCVTHEMFPGLIDGHKSWCEDGVRAAQALPEMLGPEGMLVTINRFPFPKQQCPSLDEVLARLGIRPIVTNLPDSLEFEELGMISKLPIRAYRLEASNGTTAKEAK